uniref:Uncharacterized protein n=1 Tax=Solanum lycopersicum TaxID=4081 RepID=A0A3Q7I0K0_SOLLC
MFLGGRTLVIISVVYSCKW